MPHDLNANYCIAPPATAGGRTVRTTRPRRPGVGGLRLGGQKINQLKGAAGRPRIRSGPMHGQRPCVGRMRRDCQPGGGVAGWLLRLRRRG